jgi:hypothetical protein
VTTITQCDLEVVRLHDDELIRKTWEFAERLGDDEGDRLYWLVGEMLERWAPDIYWAEEKREVRNSYCNDPEGYRRELHDRRESRASRGEARNHFRELYESRVSVILPHDETLRERLEAGGDDA